MIWMPPPASAPGPTPVPRSRRPLARVGALVAVVGLLWLVGFGVVLLIRVGTPMVQSLTAPVLTTPLDRSLSLERSEYAVYEWTGRASEDGAGADPGAVGGARPTLTPQEVVVTGPDGRPVPVRGPGPVTETLTRGEDVYTAAVLFAVPEPGRYRIVVVGRGGRVVLARSLGSGLDGAALRAALVGLPVLFAGLALLIADLRQARGAAPRPRSLGAPATVPPGWYPDPHDPQRRRYWDGDAWSERTRWEPS